MTQAKVITQQQLSGLISGRLSGRVAAKLLGVSEATVRRARHDAARQAESTANTGFSNEELTQAVGILQGALELKANAGGRIKTRIREALEKIRSYPQPLKKGDRIKKSEGHGAH